jgi:hypothetical protein
LTNADAPRGRSPRLRVAQLGDDLAERALSLRDHWRRKEISDITRWRQIIPGYGKVIRRSRVVPGWHAHRLTSCSDMLTLSFTPTTLPISIP